MTVEFSGAELDRLKNMLPVYEIGQEIFHAKLNELNKELANLQNSSPIEHIKKRLKSPQSIAQKLHRLGFEITADNAKKSLKDIAGVRIICPFSKDIFTLVDSISSIADWKVSEKEDYISYPKPSGYRSFHLTIEIPVYYSGITEEIPLEVQVRTAAMDFWAATEHQVRYKYKEHIPQHLSDELVICADKITELDRRMLLIHEILSLINQNT
jgi:putative GTP pyrophosphokinase